MSIRRESNILAELDEIERLLKDWPKDQPITRAVLYGQKMALDWVVGGASVSPAEWIEANTRR